MTRRERRPANLTSPTSHISIHNPNNQASDYYDRVSRVPSRTDQVHSEAKVRQDLRRAAALLDLWRVGDLDDAYVAMNLAQIGGRLALEVMAGRLWSERWAA